MRTYIKLYDINTTLNKAFILCISIFFRKGFVVIEKDAISEYVQKTVRDPVHQLLGNMECFGDTQNENQINADRS